MGAVGQCDDHYAANVPSEMPLKLTVKNLGRVAVAPVAGAHGVDGTAQVGRSRIVVTGDVANHVAHAFDEVHVAIAVEQFEHALAYARRWGRAIVTLVVLIGSHREIGRNNGWGETDDKNKTNDEHKSTAM